MEVLDNLAIVMKRALTTVQPFKTMLVLTTQHREEGQYALVQIAYLSDHKERIDCGRMERMLLPSEGGELLLKEQQAT